MATEDFDTLIDAGDKALSEGRWSAALSLYGRARADDSEAVRWYRRAAEQGNALGRYNLGPMYANGRGVPDDDPEAIRWYRKAADQGDAWAQNNLAVMYESGRGGLTKDDAEAVRLRKLAARQGHMGAQAALRSRSIEWD